MKRKALPWVLLGVGALLVAVGLSRGQWHMTLQKAIRICLECVGIG